VTLERDLKAAFLLAAPRELPTLRLFNRPVMRVQLHDPDRTIAVGVKGQCDLYGLVQGGLHIELELKTATGTLSDKQLAWQSFCRSWGVPHLMLKAIAGETVDTTVKRWCGEVGEIING
jgi:hypothetical protein